MSAGIGRVLRFAPLAIVAVLAVTLAAIIALDPGPAGNALQPLGEGFAWRAHVVSSTSGTTGGSDTWSAVVGRETIAGERAWWLETGVGESWANRVALVDRGGDVWAVEIQTLDDAHHWQRTVLRVAQPYQPRAVDGGRWYMVYTGTPPAFNFAASYVMHRSGSRVVLGQTRDIWRLEADVTYTGGSSHEIDDAAVGVGFVRSTFESASDTTTQELAEFRTSVPELAGTYVSHSDDGAWTLTTSGGAPAGLTGAPVSGTIANVTSSGLSLSFEVESGSGTWRWSGSRVGSGLVGELVGPDGTSRVLEFVPAPTGS